MPSSSLTFEQGKPIIMLPKLIDIHTHRSKTHGGLLQIANLDLKQPCPEEGLFSYGIHPWETESPDFQEENAIQLLKERLQAPNAVALGEAGLDKFHAGFERQTKVLERQIALSENLKKPMILHVVKSHNEILALRKKHKARQPWILHGFNGTEQDIRQLTAYGLYLSAGESLLHSERKISKSLKNIPLDLLFLETDMAEVGIETIYDTAANLLEMDTNVLRVQIFANFARLFGIEK